MPQPFDRVYNFSAGPAALPLPVLQEVQAELLNFGGAGMSLMEMSHRSSMFERVLSDAKEDLRELLGISDEYEILFLQGGASMQFTMLAQNFLGDGKAQIVVTGAWGQKAVEASKLEGTTEVVYDGKAEGYKSVPNLADLNLDPAAAYIHITSNETIQGVRFTQDPTTAAPLVCDMSSDILSRPVDISNYSLIYAGAQKNMGPAGATVVIVKKSWVESIKRTLPPMLDYRVHLKNDSLYNTPPAWAIYVCGKVYRYLLENGGLQAAHQRNVEKANIVYHAIDSSKGFYNGHAVDANRSLMNVTFTLPSEELTNKFVAEAEALGMKDLKGHRSVGGCRASIYNAFPKEGCEALAEFMSGFATRNG